MQHLSIAALACSTVLYGYVAVRQPPLWRRPSLVVVAPSIRNGSQMTLRWPLSGPELEPRRRATSSAWIQTRRQGLRGTKAKAVQSSPVSRYRARRKWDERRETRDERLETRDDNRTCSKKTTGNEESEMGKERMWGGKRLGERELKRSW